MEKRLPKRNREFLYDNVYLEGKRLHVVLNNKSITAIEDICIRKSKNIPIIIEYSGLLTNLNKVFSYFSSVNYPDKDITIVLKRVEINKNNYLAIDNLKPNVKIEIEEVAHLPQYPRTGILTWALNLTDKDFEILASKVSSNSQLKIAEIRKERKLVKEIITALSKQYDFSKMSDLEKFETIFNFVVNNTSYAHSYTQSDGNLKGDIDRLMAESPVATWQNKKGVCTGRSALVKILLNNPILNVNALCVSGKYYGSLDRKKKNIYLGHTWNILIDQDKRVYYYDTSFPSTVYKCPFSKLPDIYTVSNLPHEVKTALTKLPPDLPPRRSQ